MTKIKVILGACFFTEEYGIHTIKKQDKETCVQVARQTKELVTTMTCVGASILHWYGNLTGFNMISRKQSEWIALSSKAGC